MAKNFIDNLSEETRKGMVEKASQGIWPSYAPIGYLNADGANGKRTIKPYPALAPLVRRLYELCATGQHSVKELAAIAQSERLTRGGTINKSTVNKILRNRVYSGEFEWRGEKYTAAYESIVPRDLWLAAQAALDRRLGTRAKKTGHCFPFSGMLTCGSCGFAMVGEIKKGKYVYYHCSGSRGKCGEPSVRQETLEEAYTAMLRRISIDEEIVNWIATALRESHGTRSAFETNQSLISNRNILGYRTAWTLCTRTGSTAESTFPFSNESRASTDRSKRGLRLKLADSGRLTASTWTQASGCSNSRETCTGCSKSSKPPKNAVCSISSCRTRFGGKERSFRFGDNRLT